MTRAGTRALERAGTVAKAGMARAWRRAGATARAGAMARGGTKAKALTRASTRVLAKDAEAKDMAARASLPIECGSQPGLLTSMQFPYTMTSHEAVEGC